MSSVLTLDIILPTYNRADLLRQCLSSLLEAEAPLAMQWQVTVVDNNSQDHTLQVVESFIGKHPGHVRYLFEKTQGKSYALNRGIAESRSEVLGFLDDDEKIERLWLRTIEQSFSNDPELDYLGGPCLGWWEGAQPAWSPPPGFEGVLSVDLPEAIPLRPLRFAADAPVFLRGGNAVVRRLVFDRIGVFSQDLGRFGSGLGACEDEDMYRRLLRDGCKGVFEPALCIFHHVPHQRVTRAYHRRWAWGQSSSRALLERRYPLGVPHVGRVPRYMIGETLRGLANVFSPDPRQRFSAELRCWSLAGYVYGAYGKA